MNLGDRGDNVKRLQESLTSVGYGTSADGVFGKQTLAAVQAHARDATRQGVRHWHVTGLEVEAKQGAHADAKAQQAVGLTTVGAWVGAAALLHPERDVAFAKSIGLNRLDVVCNDHSKDRSSTRFRLYNTAKIRTFCDVARDAGIEVHLMSWVMPHASFVERAAEEMGKLVYETGAKSVMWDAEEPWTQAKGGLSRELAAEVLAAEFNARSVPMGVTGIGYASKAKLGPLAKVCDYVVPQAYVTGRGSLKPESAPGKFAGRWSQAFGRKVLVGLAAYRQRGIEGHTATSAIQTAAKAAAKVTDTVVYWYLPTIRASSTVARAIAGVREAVQ